MRSTAIRICFAYMQVELGKIEVVNKIVVRGSGVHLVPVLIHSRGDSATLHIDKVMV